MPKGALDGILRGTDQLIDEQLGNHRHGTVGQALVEAPRTFAPKKLLEGMIVQIENNLEEARDTSKKIKLGKSAENWREESPSPEHDERKPERDLEHILVRVGERDPNWIWWNQMPIASGLVGHRADRTRAIDLVCKHRTNRTHYRLIELKIDRGAGAPLVALMEILRYGLVYLVVRKHRGSKWFDGISLNASIFEAGQIDLCVLAPKDYYDGYELSWLETSLANELNKILSEQLDGHLAMSLASYWPTRLDNGSGWVAPTPDMLMTYLTDWTKAFPS